jgi:hypothetical protein
MVLWTMEKVPETSFQTATPPPVNLSNKSQNVSAGCQRERNQAGGSSRAGGGVRLSTVASRQLESLNCKSQNSQTSGRLLLRRISEVQFRNLAEYRF